MREEMATGSPMGLVLTAHAMEAPTYPDEVALGIIARELTEPRYASGAVLDGCPRTRGQAAALVSCFLRPTDACIALVLQVDYDVLFQRIGVRFVCE